jgi:hypothetical protein
MNGRIKKQSYVVLVVFSVWFLICSGLVSAAGLSQADDPHDVCHISQEDNIKNCNQTYPSVDIVKVARAFSEDTLQLIMVLNGQIEENNESYYQIWYNTSGNNSVYRYMMNYSQTDYTVWMINPDGNKTLLNVSPQITDNKHIITVYIPQAVVKSNENIEGVAKAWDETGVWIDHVTSTKTIDPTPFNGTTTTNSLNGENDSSDSVPGFHLIFILIGMGIVIGIFKRKR